MTGANTIDALAPIERLPLFVKAGAILPMGPVVQYAGEKPDAPLELRIYRGADGHFTLYDDVGDGYGYEKGERATIPMSWDDKSGTLTLGARAGRYPGMPPTRQFQIVVVNGDHGAGPDTTANPDQLIDYDGSAKTIKLPKQ
jgi:alpha-D-xyloside xylohydrolase